MSQGARNVAFLVGLALAVIAVAYGLSSRTGSPRDALAMAPRRTVAVAELDVPGTRASALWTTLVGDGDDGMRRIRETCGFDPLDQLRTLDVFLLRAPDASADELEASLDEVAFVARGELDHEALVRCIGEVVAGDGGGVHATTIEGVEAIASDRGSSVAAFYGRDGLVAGADTIVAELLRIQEGASPAMERDAGLARLWARASSRRHLRLVALLPRNWQRFLGQLAELAGDLSSVGSARALALGATFGEGIALTLALELADHDVAVEARRALETQVAAAIADREIGVSALSVALRRLTLRAEGADLILAVELDRAELDASVAVIRRMLAPEPRLRLPNELPPPLPDETLAPGSSPAEPGSAIPADETPQPAP